MRYSFQDFLDYQNELNDKCNEENVDCAIDDILQELRGHIEQWPTAHMIKIFHVLNNEGVYVHLSNYTWTELNSIADYFEDRGYSVDFLHAQEEEKDSIIGIKISW